MGVPKFYRWVSERYPLINQQIGSDVQFLAAIDNMYLDMNGIIHTCTHPNDEDVSAKLSLKDMVLGMFSYIDRMVHIVRPQKVLMLAVDGCAPRAKMNQQRSRRFASAKERREAIERAVKAGELSEEEVKEKFDSNCITPGTEFMEAVSRHFQYFIRMKIKEDPLWRKLKIIYSGHDVPGEGEHKILEYIRHTRMQPGYDPNTRHCLCGLDADLIMLGLASHEPHFVLLREEVDFTGGRGGKIGGSQSTKEVKKQVQQDRWELLHISALRQYLDLEYSSLDLPFEYNLERVIDDWVLLIMLMGNDFLPHLPSLAIAEGGLDDLIHQYKTVLPTLGGYITDDAKVHFERLEKVLDILSLKEEEVFMERKKRFERDSRRDRAEKQRQTRIRVLMEADGEIDDDDDEEEVQQVFSAPFKEYAREQGIVTSSSTFKEKYYGEKFGVSLENEEVLNRLIQEYVRGIKWCFEYYYQGVPSWTWFFPFHYAPLASDLKNLDAIETPLSMGRPFKPFTQLLSCLPADSAQFLPKCYRELMTLSTSPLREFYPNTFNVDMEGKRNAWEGVNLLPFIDEKRLQAAVEEHCPEEKLTDAEQARNLFGHEIIVQQDLSNTSTVRSTLPGVLPDINLCGSSISRFVLPAMSRFDPNLLAGVAADGRWPGDAQLQHGLTLWSEKPAELKNVGLQVFNRPSKRASFVLNVRMPSIFSFGDIHTVMDGGGSVDDDESMSMAAAVVKTLQSLQNKQSSRLHVFVDFPYMREAEVVQVADDILCYTLIEEKKKRFVFHKAAQTDDEGEHFLMVAERAQDGALKGIRKVGTGGIDTGEVVVMLKVRPLQKMEMDPETGAMRQVFADLETWVPYQLVLYHNEVPDPRFLPRLPMGVEERFPVSTRILCLQKQGYGLVGAVVGHSQGKVEAEFSTMHPRIPPFGHSIANAVVDQYIPSYKVAKMLNLDGSTLGKITGSVLVRPGEYDIGLNLKVGKTYMIAGYARSRNTASSGMPAWSTGESVMVISGLDPEERKNQHDGSGGVQRNASAGWEFSKRAIDLIKTYMRKFPFIFQILRENPQIVEYERSLLFGPGLEGESKLHQVCKWLEQIETFRLPLVPISSTTMSREAIMAVQRASDDVRKSIVETKTAGTTVVKLSPGAICKFGSDIESEWVISPSASQPPRLGDRIVNMGSPVVPFGLGGTVVAAHPSTGCVEVIFDEEFVGGTSLYGACGPNRGKLLPWNQLLNISKPTPRVLGPAKPQENAWETPKNLLDRPKPASKPVAKPAAPRKSAHDSSEGFYVPPKTEAAKSKTASSPSNFLVPLLEAKRTSTAAKQLQQEEVANDSVQLKKLEQFPPSVSENKGEEDDLAQFWLQLQENKSKPSRRSNRSKDRKEMDQSKTISKQPLTEAPVSNAYSRDQAATMLINTGTNGRQTFAKKLMPPPTTVSSPEKEPDELDSLFKRASEAKGKQYKGKIS